ncbi:MAG: GspE/PulE family protein [Candidatus Paceibacteria bacterium]
MSFLDDLAQRGLIEKDQIKDIKTLAETKYNGDVEAVLYGIGLTEDQILLTKGEYFNMPVKKVGAKDISFDILKYIPEDSARHYGFAPFALEGGVLEVGVTDPENIAGIDALQFISAKLGMPFKIFLITKSDYERIMGSYKGVTAQVGQAVDAINGPDTSDDQGASEYNLNQEIQNAGKPEEKLVEDAPVIKIVAVILRNAIEGAASDIHIEHVGDRVKVRYRVDGSLHTTLTLPANVHAGVVARVKILAKLRLDEKRKPQDGSFSTNVDGKKIDFRVSTLPGYYGEKVAIRILDSERGVRRLDEIGIQHKNLNIFKQPKKTPNVIILFRGPSVFAKTTTLYSIMNELDKEKNNVVTLEDPIEYHMPDVNQSQVMPEIGYTFASGLRSILRQDPNVIMVGEIRDKETAQLAIQAALTGHLVLSTLHTNNAIGAIPRLVDMGVDPYLIAPTLILSVAQRLARMTCPSSRKQVPMDPSIKQQIEDQLKDLPNEYRNKIQIKEQMYDTVPSSECPSGTRGRIAIFEMLKIDQEIESVILKNPVYSEIYAVARKNGMLLMKEDAILKALDGIIPMTETYRFSNEGE